MSNWRSIEGFKYPYRINEDATVECLENGEWVKLTPFVQHGGGRAPRLCVRLVNIEGHLILRPVKRLMIEAFFGGSKEGVSYGLRNSNISDCSLENIYPLSKNELKKRRKAYRKMMEERENAEEKGSRND